MQLYQIADQPHTYIVETSRGRQLGIVDEFHQTHQTHPTHKTHHKITYIGTRFDGRGMFEQKEFSGFTAALQFVSGK